MKESNGGFLISKIKQIQGRIFEKLLIEYGIEEFNSAQGRILFVLWKQDNLPIVELSHKTGLAKTTLTGMLDRLENMGYLLRNFDKKDRRQVRITLTARAKDMNSKYMEVSSKMTEIFYKNFNSREIVMFENFLERILENLQINEETK